MLCLRIGFAGLLVCAVSCTNDYDRFQVGQGGSTAASIGGSTSTSGGHPSNGGNPNNGGGGSASTTTNMGGGGNGNPTTTTTTTSTGGGGSTSTTGGGGSGGGGGSPTNTVPCGPPTTCDLDSGQICCFDTDNTTVSCELTADCNQATLACNGPQDCAPGDVCCFVFDQGNLSGTECRNSCMGGSELCDPSDPSTCPSNQDCVDSGLLPDGYFRCN